MNSKSLKTLEFDKIKSMLISHADSPSGKKLCEKLSPLTDIDEIDSLQEETSAALSRLLKNGNISFSNARDLSASLKRLELGSCFNTKELLETAALLENASLVKKYGKKDRNRLEDDCLEGLFNSLIPCEQLMSEIRNCIISEDEISDNASPALFKIRKSIKFNEEKIHSQLNSMINGSARTYLQDAVITMRNGRYCIPVKNEYRGRIQGMIHDQSSSGSTVFIEPMPVIKLNNDIKQLEGEEEKEIEKILQTLSTMVFENSGAIKTDMETLISLDFIFARALLALDMNAIKPNFNSDGIVVLKKARHPLIDKKNVVPIDVSLGNDFDLLIITGPNTGGKTVALKTVGLLSAMGQAGLHIPALSSSQLTVFDNIFADIGDEQSIEQSLSTFSSHMKNVVYILDHADENSLVLFDELGAGTDPIEGAALATAILSFLHNLKIRTIATTHYSELKLYALSTEGVENASCEFDVQSLRPTYRLLTGVPGKSNAFAISEKLGIPSYIIDDAKERIGKEDETFEDIISKLEKSRIELEKEQAEIARLRSEADSIRKSLENRERDFIDKKSTMVQKANEEAFTVLKEAKDYADSVMKLFQKASHSNPQVRDLERKRTELRTKMNKAGQNMSLKKEEKPHKELKPGDVRVGDSVKVLSMNLKGTITTKPDSKGYVTVQMGILKSKVHLSDLVLTDEPTITAKNYTSGNAGKIKFAKTMSVSPEINLLGKTVDEAVSELDKYLDDAYISHLSEVRVVHGKGTGALRKGIHSYLKGLSIVKEFHLAEFGEGDAGVTIVKFRNT